MNIESYKKCSSAISLQGREKSVRKSSIRAGNELHSDGGFQSKEADIRRYVTYSDDMNKELSDVKSYDAIKLQ